MQTDSFARAAIAPVIDGLKNPNGCPVPVTFFTMKSQTPCDEVLAAYNAGHEIATHTVSHLAMGPAFKNVEAEIMGARDYLTTTCGLPTEDVTGFRSPYLINNPPIRAVLAKNGFLYDSSINEHWPMPTSASGASRLFPYSMDNGIPQDCAWTSNVCTPDEKYPGLWEVPVWVEQTAQYPAGSYAMDYEGDVLSLLKSNFDAAYNGNRAPIGVFGHTPWNAIPVRCLLAFSICCSNEILILIAHHLFLKIIVVSHQYTHNFLQSNQAAIRAFLTEQLKKPDVYAVTMRQLVEWMKNPIPADQVGAWLGCGKGGKPVGLTGAASIAPAAAAAAPVAQAPTTPVAATPAAVIVPPQTTGQEATKGAAVIATSPTAGAPSSSGYALLTTTSSLIVAVTAFILL